MPAPTVGLAAAALSLAASGLSASPLFVDAVYERSEIPPRHSSLPVPTIDAILGRHRTAPELMGWDGTDRLLIEGVNGLKRSTREITTRDGRESVVEGWSVTPSPDGTRRIHQDNDGWVVEMGERRVRIPNPSAKIDRAWRCAWSADSRYVAIAARMQPLALPKTPPLEERNGVRIRDFAALARDIPTSLAFLTIVDTTALQGATHVARWHEIDERIGEIAWGSKGVYFASARFFVKEPYTVVGYLEPGFEAPREVYRSRGRFQTLRPCPSPDGTLLAVGIDADTRFWDAFVSIVLVDPASGREVRRVTRDVPVLARSMHWARDGKSILCVVRQGGLDQLARIDLEGRVTYLTDGLRKHFNPQYANDGIHVAYQTEDGFGRQDLRVLDLETRRETVVKILDDPTREFRLGAFIHVRWKSDGGIAPYGYVILPPDFDPAKRYPMIVDVHGGGSGSSLYLHPPFTIQTAPGPLEWHAWASQGYVVFAPDYRSTGYYGPVPAATRAAPDRDVTGDDVKDVVAGVHFMAAQPFIDGSRAGIIGHSAGGARTYRLLTENPTLFRAAVLNEGAPPDPLSTVIALTTGSYTGREFEGITRDVMGASLAEAPGAYKRNTMFDAYRVRTATLIMMGNEAHGGIQHMPHEVLYSILRAYGTPTRLLCFEDEGHNYSRAESSRLAFGEAASWFARYVRGESRSETTH